VLGKQCNQSSWCWSISVGPLTLLTSQFGGRSEMITK